MKYESGKYVELDKIFSNLHALSGSGTTSYFFGLGKSNTFRKAVETYSLHNISKLGENLEISDECIQDCKEYIRCIFYHGKPNESYLQT